MKRRSFIGAVFGGGAAVAASAVVASPREPENPAKGQRNLLVRVFEPVKKGARLICSKTDDGSFNAWPQKEGETAHCITIMDATFEFENPILNEDDEIIGWETTVGVPHSQLVAVNVL